MIEVILLIVFLAISIFLNIKFLRTQEKYEEALDLKDDEIDLLILHYSNILQKIKEIDSKGSFEADDEVGTTFSMLVQAIEEGKEYLRKYIQNDTGNNS